MLRVVHPPGARVRAPALWASLFGIFTLAAMVSRVWAPLHHPNVWAGMFSGPGDFPPKSVVDAVLNGQSVGAAYVATGQPYPLPYLIAFVPVGLLGDPWLRPAATALSIGLLVFSMWLMGALRRNPAMWPVLVSPPFFFDLLSPHLTTEVGLAGLCLAAWAQPRRRWILLGVGIGIGFIRPPNALPLLAVLVYTSWGNWRGLFKAAAAAVCLVLPLVAIAFWLDPNWVTTYSVNVAQAVYAGLPLIAIYAFGPSGLFLIQAAAVLAALVLARSSRGKPLDPDLGAYVIALGVLPSKLSGVYSGLYALPAVARLGLRPRLWWTPWVVSAAAWLFELSLFPGTQASVVGPPWETVIAYWFVFAAWPLAVPDPSPAPLKIGQARV